MQLRQVETLNEQERNVLVFVTLSMKPAIIILNPNKNQKKVFSSPYIIMFKDITEAFLLDVSKLKYLNKKS